MKRTLAISALALVVVLGAAIPNKLSAQQHDNAEVTYQTFYDDLSPYGRWIDNPEYGYVWRPDVDADFRPYNTNGHWVYTDDYEWLWVSDYNWGWAPFHYGRWYLDPIYGWLWVPGYEWAPAWVAWRGGADYYGWAPLRPGINISVGFSIGSYYAPDDYWCFAPSRYILSPRIYDYCIDRRRNTTYINTTIIINNYSRSRNVFVTGPSRFEAERYCGRISPVRFNTVSRPGRTIYRNNQVNIFRPNVQRDDNRSFTPRSFDRYDRNSAGNRDRIADNDRIRRNDNGVRDNNNDIRRNNGDIRRNNDDTRRNNNDVRRNNDITPNNGGRDNEIRRDNPRTNPSNNLPVRPENDNRRIRQDPPNNANNDIIRNNNDRGNNRVRDFQTDRNRVNVPRPNNDVRAPRNPNDNNNRQRDFQNNRSFRNDNPVNRQSQVRNENQRQLSRDRSQPQTRSFDRKDNGSNNGNSRRRRN